jgi:chromosome segregation ATPase
MDDNDVRQRLLNYNAGRASQEVIAAAAEITRLRARLAEMEADLAYTNKRLEHAFERNERQAQTIDALTVALATAREDALEEAAQVVDARKSIIEVGTELSSRIREMKDTKP